MSAMEIGMLWLCEKKTLSDDIAAAAEYHRTKYGPVNTVHLNAPMTDPVWDSGLLNMRQDHSLHPATLWIGWVEPKQKEETP